MHILKIQLTQVQGDRGVLLHFFSCYFVSFCVTYTLRHIHTLALARKRTHATTNLFFVCHTQSHTILGVVCCWFVSVCSTYFAIVHKLNFVPGVLLVVHFAFVLEFMCTRVCGAFLFTHCRLIVGPPYTLTSECVCVCSCAQEFFLLFFKLLFDDFDRIQ